MSDPAGQGSADAEGLQFDQAEYDAPAASGVACTACKRPVGDGYFEVNGNVICAECRDAIQARLAGGSRTRLFLRAAAFGTVAAVLGCALYFAVTKLTG